VRERDGKVDGHLGLLWRRVAGWLLAAVPPFLTVPEQADHGEKRCNVSVPVLAGDSQHPARSIVTQLAPHRAGLAPE
jgi:hypothetical protein